MKAALASALLAAAPAAAECRLALALGFDVSRSVDARDYAIQRDGLAAALGDPVIRSAFLAPRGHVALAVFEWSGAGHQETVLGWTEVTSEAALAAIAARIAAREQPALSQPTAIGGALLHAHRLFRDAPPCAAATLDLSGDGRNNDGMSPAEAYARADYDGILVNALAIGGHESDIAVYYGREVIRGPGAFVEIAASHEDFPPAIRRKLERELTEPASAALPRPDGAG